MTYGFDDSAPALPVVTESIPGALTVSGWRFTRVKVSLRSWGTSLTSYMRGTDRNRFPKAVRTSTVRITPSLPGINRVTTPSGHFSRDLWRSCTRTKKPLSNHHDLRSHAKVAGCEYNQQSRQTKTCPGEIYATRNGDLDQTATPRSPWGNGYVCSPTHDLARNEQVWVAHRRRVNQTQRSVAGNWCRLQPPEW